MSWNGRKACVSLTFDDGLPCQRQNAIPEMDKRNVKGTFFLIQNSPYEEVFALNFWKQAIKNGHEVGSHSVNHRKLADCSVMEQTEEMFESKRWLETNLGVGIASYAYPYTDANDNVMRVSKLIYRQSRGGRVARGDKFLVPGDGVNLHNLPCYHVGPSTMANDEIPGWINEAMERKAWLILMFHAVGDPAGWDNLSVEQFAGLLDFLKEVDGLWIATLAQAADAYRAARK